MAMRAYLAGPIAGCNQSEAKDWRAYVGTKLHASGITAVSPLRCEPIVGEEYALQYDDPRFGTPAAISGKNWFDTANADLVLAYLPKQLNDRRPSYGTIIEIGWAIGMRKPVVLVTDDEHLAHHPLIARNVDWILDDLTTAIDVIEGLLGIYAERTRHD